MVDFRVAAKERDIFSGARPNTVGLQSTSAALLLDCRISLAAIQIQCEGTSVVLIRQMHVLFIASLNPVKDRQRYE